MTTSRSDELRASLRLDAAAPAEPPQFFDVLAMSARQSTPSTGPGLVTRVRGVRVVAAIAGTALLISGTAFASGFIGGGNGRDATPVKPADSPSKVDGWTKLPDSKPNHATPDGSWTRIPAQSGGGSSDPADPGDPGWPWQCIKYCEALN